MGGLNQPPPVRFLPSSTPWEIGLSIYSESSSRAKYELPFRSYSNLLVHNDNYDAIASLYIIVNCNCHFRVATCALKLTDLTNLNIIQLNIMKFPTTIPN